MRRKFNGTVNEDVCKALIEYGSDVHVIADIKGAARYVSSSIRKVLGYTPEEALKLNPANFFHPDDTGQIKSGLAECLKNPGVPIKAGPMRVRHKNLQWIWVEGLLTNLLNNADINGFVFNFRDITGSRKAKYRLIKSQLFNKSVLSSLEAHIAVVNQWGEIIAVNKAWDNFAMANGATSAAATSHGSNYFEACEKAAPRDTVAAGTLKGIKAVLKGETEKFELEYPCHSPTEQRWFVLSATSLGAGTDCVVVSHQNITDRKLAENKLAENENRFRGLIENSAEGIVILSSTGKPNYVSPAVENLLGYSHDEAMALNLFDIAHPDDVPFITDLIGRCIASPRVPIKSSPVRIKHKNGEWRWMDGVITNMLDDPAINGIVDNFWDVTEHKISETKILHANRLYAFLSHTNQAILRTNDDQTLFTEACRIAVEVGGFKTAWIGLFNEKKDEINMVASYGAPKEALKVFTGFRFQKNGPIDKIVQGQDFSTKEVIPEHTAEWNELVTKNAYKGVISLGIKRFGKLLGTFNIYSTESAFFDDEEISLLRECTSEISFALNVFEKDRLRSRTELALKESERRLNEAQAIAKVGSWETDLETLSVVWSAESHKIFETETFGGTHDAFMAFVHPRDRVKMYNAFANSVEHKQDGSAEHRIITAKGNLKAVRESWTLYIDLNGRPVRAVGTCQDITEQKNSEEVSRFKAHLLNTIGQAAVAVDLNGIITYWNKAAENIYGWNQSEALGKDISHILPHRSPSHDINEISTDLNDGRTRTGECNIQRKDGKIIPVAITDSPVYDEQNRRTGSIAISSDISEKKALEELLNKANSLAKIGNYEVDLVNGSLYWSDITKQIHEVPHDFIPDVATAINFYKEGADRAQISEALNEAITNGKPYDLDLQIITAKGTPKWVRVIGEAEFKDDRCIRVYGSFQDIDKLKQAQIEALKAFKEKESILESLGDGFLAVDKSWTVTYWNTAAERLIGKTKQEALHANLWELFPEVVGTPFYSYYHKAVKENISQHFEAYYEALQMWIEVSCYPSATGLAVYFRDVTERKLQDIKLLELNYNLQKYTEELVLSNKGLEQFSYIISHNLRSPVANILGLSTELKNPLHDDDTKDFLLSGLITNVKHLDTVIADLNTILQVKSQINELKEPVILTSIIEGIKQSIGHVIKNEKVRIKTSGIIFDEFFTLKSYFYSIFYNLISNGIKYRRPEVNPVIEIKTTQKDEKLYISIKDNGKGINLVKHKEHIFGLYKRFHRDVEGKGMGLFMVKTQVEAIGGKISVNSEVNAGTEFIIEFNI